MKDFCLFQAESLKNSPAAAKSLISVYFQVVLLISEFLRELIFCMNCYLYFRALFEFLREQTLFISEFLYYSRRAAVTSKPKLVPHIVDGSKVTSEICNICQNIFILEFSYFYRWSQKLKISGYIVLVMTFMMKKKSSKDIIFSCRKNVSKKNPNFFRRKFPEISPKI